VRSSADTLRFPLARALAALALVSLAAAAAVTAPGASGRHVEARPDAASVTVADARRLFVRVRRGRERRVARHVLHIHPLRKPARRRNAPKNAQPGRRVPNDPLWPEAWSLVKLRGPEAWAHTTGAPSTVVAVLDTGVDLGHPDLKGAFVQGHDFVNDDADPSDDHGHGTMIAGIVAAQSDNNIGVASYCWRCSLMPLKVIGANGIGSSSDVAEAIVWATDHGARVVNMSLVFAGDDPAVASAVKYARERGVVVVAAAGNTGDAAVMYPAAYAGVVSVAGTDGADVLYSWSTHGAWVRVAAPGCNVTTARNDQYTMACGTSSATAAVAGLAAIARSFAPRASNVEIERALEQSSVPVGSFVASGRVDAQALLAALRR
jgi:subtilisin family serine protease